MKVCLCCDTRFDGSGWRCPSCFHTPETLAGFPAFAPRLARSNTGFKASYFDELAELEAGNFWFRARNRLVVWALKQYFPNAGHFFEIGCGTGFVLYGIRDAFPYLKLSGSEILSDGLAHAARRLPKASFYQMDARALPFDSEFDVIGAFDVLEHIEDDGLVLKQMFRATRPGGGVILTVPQHPSLWSQTDESACHVRRYTGRNLEGKVTQAGFTVLRRTSFVSLLLPLMVASRLRKRASGENKDVMDELRISKTANAVLEKILNLERRLLRFGVNFPAGGSLLLVARKG